MPDLAIDDLNMKRQPFIQGASLLDELQRDTVLAALANYRNGTLSYDVAQSNGVRVVEGMLRTGELLGPEDIPEPIFPLIDRAPGW